VALGKYSRVVTSTFQAESGHAFYCYKHMKYKWLLLGFSRLRSNDPFLLWLDNSATVLMAGAPIKKFSQASKHFEI
jgi:hypothetical protein